MRSQAVIFEAPGRLVVNDVVLTDPGVDDVVVESRWSGISTGTERLLWSGNMPPFPGLGYPLVPGYETVGTIVDASRAQVHRIGEQVFVPGSSAYEDVKGLFGGTAGTLITSSAKAVRVDEAWADDSVLLALAATAHHALAGGDLPDLIIGHGVLGRLMARIAVAMGANDLKVCETNAARRDGATGYAVIDPDADEARYANIIDVSGDASVLDSMVRHLNPGGEIVLAGFYSDRVSFAFPPAFMKEARFRVAAEWKPADMDAVLALLREGRFALDGLITHRKPAADAANAYDTAFGDADCLKMVLNWSDLA
ncbi:MAG: chlorophyll synthesis pathway protein BchC [Pseudomonadota bacterium]